MNNLKDFEDAIRLFIDNNSVNKYNAEKLLSLKPALTELVAFNSSNRVKSVDDELFRGFKKSIFVCIDAHIAFTSNLWTQVGIVNGAFGIVRDIIYPLNKKIDSLPEIVFIELNDYNGPQYLIDPARKNWIPINVASAYKHQLNATRTHFPIRLAYAMTIHRAQGLTLKKQ
jgi:ATP-dependent DNA helicase PIF1